MTTPRTPHSLLRHAGAVVAALGLAAALGLSACGDDDDSADAPDGEAGITIENAWARTSPMEASAGAAYLDIVNDGTTDDALTSVTVADDLAGKVELHETRAAEADAATGMDGTTPSTGHMGTAGSTPAAPMMEMVPVDRIEVPAGGTTSLAPGGYHIMLLDLAEPLADGSDLELTLTFERAGDIVVNAVVGDTAP